MRKDLPKTRAVQVLRFGAARIRSLTLAITRRFFAGIARCAGFLLTLAAVRTAFAGFGRCEDFFAEIRRCEDRFAGFCHN